jgi:hypothetical protein
MSILQQEEVTVKVGREEIKSTLGTYLLPSLLLMLGALLIVVSMFLPYWQMTLKAPQYPKGLHVQVYVNKMTGDVQEVDGLNHYIGMPKLEEAAQLERSFSVIAIVVLAFLLMAGVFIHNQWAGILALPAILYPAIFLADMAYWLYSFGHNLDPKAALSSSIEPFTPPVLGEGVIGQFRTVATMDVGLIVAVGASLVILIGLWFHRRAYKPLVDARKRQAQPY